MKSPERRSSRLAGGLAVACAVGLILAAPLPAQESYAFVRTVDGYADLVQGSSQAAVEMTANYPILVGDQLRIAAGGRVEVVLPDGSYVRFGDNTELKFGRIAYSGDTYDETTLLHLIQGEIQIVAPEGAVGDDAFRIDTANASIYLRKQGTYRIFSDGESWTEVIVRDGFAEVLTERGSVVARTGEQTLVNGSRSPQVTVEAAGPIDALELWGDRLLAAAQAPEQPAYVEPSLAYASAPLRTHGSWVQVGGGVAWRPYVAAGWRPYHSGWWVHTPSGLTWVSTEPWGWVTYHYGVWDYALGFGWVWYPGRVYTPAAVYWYWGPSHVGWIPAGYYTRYYGYPYPYHHHPYYGPRYYPRPGFGFHLGIYGWAGGSVSFWSDWTFCSYRHFGHRSSHGYLRTGAQLTREGSFKSGVPRGIIATDTRALKPELWSEPNRVLRTLQDSRIRGQGSGSAGRELPDVTAWVSRSRQLPESVSRAVMTERGHDDSVLSLGSGTRSRRDRSPSPTAASSEARRSLSGQSPSAARSSRSTSQVQRVTPQRQAPSVAPSRPTSGGAISRPTPGTAPSRPVQGLGSERRSDADWRIPAPRRSTPGEPSARPEASQRPLGRVQPPASSTVAPRAQRSLVPGTEPRTPARTWDPGVWQRTIRAQPQAGAPASPDRRSLVPRAPGSRETPVVRRVWEGVRSYRQQERSPWFGSSRGIQRPTAPLPGSSGSRIQGPSPRTPSSIPPARPGGSVGPSRGSVSRPGGSVGPSRGSVSRPGGSVGPSRGSVSRPGGSVGQSRGSSGNVSRPSGSVGQSRGSSGNVSRPSGSRGGAAKPSGSRARPSGGGGSGGSGSRRPPG